MSNKKVRNAKASTFKGINFKSKLEVACYARLIEGGFSPLYEPHKFILMEKFRPEYVRIYQPKRVKGVKDFIYCPYRIRAITYTPDFYLEHKKYKIYIETKGRPNETYPIKKKLFLLQLEEAQKNKKGKFLFFEPSNISQIVKTIQIIKEL